jgi:lysozyme
MNIDKLREELKIDEGVKYEIYLDHLGLPTFGIGHLVLDTDPEHGMAVGTPISEDRVNACFDTDVAIVIDECRKLYEDFDDLPGEAQLIIANMLFNMGRPRLAKFVGMKRGVDAGDWTEAADQMVDSRWYRQVPNRAERLVERMRLLEIAGIPV